MEIVPHVCNDVYIDGGGVAACGAAHLLLRTGCRVAWRETLRPRLPAILLNGPAQALLSDIFEKNDLFRGGHSISKRVVSWGDRETVTLEHSARVISEETLLDRLRPRTESAGDRAAWRIATSRPSDSTEQRFGARTASIARVDLKDGSACAIESLDDGWLFLLPDAARSGWLIAVGGANLEKSRVVTKMISRANPATVEFPAYPRILSPLAAPSWLACGSAAMAFDPICGDGTANAVREAILASAVIGAALRGENVSALTQHYEDRLRLGFKRHLMLCRDYYRVRGEWWDRERASIDEGIAWCGEAAQFHYKMVGLELAPIS